MIFHVQFNYKHVTHLYLMFNQTNNVSQEPNFSAIWAWIRSTNWLLPIHKSCCEASKGLQKPSNTTKISRFSNCSWTSMVNILWSYIISSNMEKSLIWRFIWRWQAIEYARLNHSTTAFFNLFQHEKPSSRWGRISWNASKVWSWFMH